MEEQVDQEINQLERLDEDGLEALKRKRMGMVVFYRYLMDDFLLTRM